MFVQHIMDKYFIDLIIFVKKHTFLKSENFRFPRFFEKNLGNLKAD